MHKSRPTIFLTTILCILLQTVSLLPAAHAQISQIQFENLSSKDGLSQVSIHDIVEDSYGFMWFATADGLNRYDGYEFTQYNYRRDDPTSIPTKYIRSLFIDSKDRLWVATDNGLALFERKNDRFINFKTANSELKSNDIWSVTETSDSKILISAENSLYQFDETQNKPVFLETFDSVLSSSIRIALAESDKIWLGSTESGIAVLSVKENVTHNLSEPNPWNLLVDAKSIKDIKKINNQTWIATNNGVYVISGSNELIAHYTTESQPALNSNYVDSIAQTHTGQIWIGTDAGINILQIDSDLVVSIDASNEKSVGLEDRTVFKIFEDSKQTIWVGTHSKGVHKFNPNSYNIRHFTHQKSNSNSLSNDMVWSLEEDSLGQIWVATQSGGINMFNRDTANFKRFLVGFDQLIYDLVIDKNDKVWIGTTNGMYVFTYTGGELKQAAHFLSGTVIPYIKQLGDHVYADNGLGSLVSISVDDLALSEFSTPNKNIGAIAPLAKDSKNNLWVSTSLGLAYFDLDTRQFNQLIIELKSSGSFFINVYEENNVYWVVTSEDGIFKLDAKNLSVIEQINDLPELQDLTILSSAKIDDSIWLGSARLVYELSMETGNIVHKITSDMLNSNNLAEDSALATQDGQLLFGGSEGFHLFWPEKIELLGKPLLPSPSINGLSVYNKPITAIGENSPLSKPVYMLNELTLNNDDSPFSLHFAQINAINSDLIEYRYKIEEINKDWLNADPRTREASYTNLSFGSYNFYVQNRMLKGQWSEPAHLVVKIAPPLWLHRNAIVLYGFFLFLMLAYWFKQYKTKRAGQIAIQESEERLKLTLWSSGDELWDWDIYRGQVFRANTWGTLDFPQDNIRANSSYQANIHADDIPKVQEALNKHMKDDTDHFQVTYRAKTFKGEWIWLLDRGKVVRRDNNNQPLRMTGTLKNISHLKQAEEQLKLFKRSIETISDGVFIADTTFKFISVNQSYCDYTGETREQALASYLTFHQYPEAFTDEVKKSLQHKSNWFGEVESRRANGDKYEMELNIDAVQGEDGKISHYVGVFSDITSRKSTEKELLKLANTDPLTEMPNRSFFQASHGNLVRKNAHHALICLDMDNFKKINDSLGHQTGDILIKQIGKRLQKISGISSTCYRLGGDEFSILIDNTTDMHRITHFAQRILDDMARPFLINKQEFVLGASVGIAFYPEDGSSPQELLKNADTAMYFAKNAGGNKYQFFSGEMNQNAVRQLQIENLIRHGLKEDLFTVFYQPKVDIASGKLVSMEALVRFEHPEKGIVSPSQFIPLAEETGQIIEIGERVMQKACEDTKRWVQQGLFTGRVAVNISARQFELPDLDDKINAILQKVGLSALHLECEITEGTLMQNPDQALRMMERLRERGIHLALDDFGTGYSSLAYLKKFPLNTLKIDKAFIDDIATSSVDKHMTAAIINIAHNLGLKVVAEGVEQEKQLSILRRYDCEMLQGYLYSKPLSSARFERLLKENLQLTQLMKSPS